MFTHNACSSPEGNTVRLRRFDTITTIFADGGYTGKLIDWAREMFDYRVEVVKRHELHTFQVLPKR